MRYGTSKTQSFLVEVELSMQQSIHVIDPAVGLDSMYKHSFLLLFHGTLHQRSDKKFRENLGFRFSIF